MKSYIRVQLYYSLFRKMKGIGMNHEMKFDTRGIQAYIMEYSKHSWERDRNADRSIE